MSLPNQIYRYGAVQKPYAGWYLGTILLLLSNFLHATPAVYAKDSLKANKIISENDSSISFHKDSLNFNDSTFGTIVDTLPKNDSSLKIVADTLHKKRDTIDVSGEGDVQDIINYKADDSIVYDMTSKKMFLYNKGDVAYQKIKLKANFVDFDWTTMTLGAQGSDSSGTVAGTPVFTEDGKDYRAKKMAYNFKTKKGIIYDVITKEGDAFIHSSEVKKNDFDEWYGLGSKYTTCDLDDPHFYFKAKRVKIIPDKVMVAGPCNLWVAGVPTPLYLPFGIFPIKPNQHSGIIMPEYGQDAILGFFIRNGGYYWAVNNYLDLKFTGQISTNGTFGLTVASNYAWRYRFNGAFSFSYLRSAPADPDIPGAKATNSYALSWTHTEDPRSLPNSTFGASVQMQSADFYQDSRITDQRLLNTSFNSTISYAHTFTGTPFNFSANLRNDENLLYKTIDFTLPTVRLSMSRVTPFKSKISTGVPKWYENIGISYSFEVQNQISTYDSTLFTTNTLQNFNLGANQNLVIDAPIKAFKYLNITPSFTYQERTYIKEVHYSWDRDTSYVPYSDGYVDTLNGQIRSDTTTHFISTHYFIASITFSTKVTGIFNFKNKYIKAIRHVFTPSVALNYQPDFSAPGWGYYQNTQYNAIGQTERLPIFEQGAIYGYPPVGKQGSVTWTLANNLDMKAFSKKDSVNHEKKMGLLDQVNLSGGYNFAADSLRLLPFNLTVVSSKVLNLINLNFGATFDPYATDSSNNDINEYQYTFNHHIVRFASANFSASTSLHSKTTGAPAVSATPNGFPPGYANDYVSYNPDQPYNFNMPWSLNLAYRFNLTRGTSFNPDTLIKVQSITISGDINLTPHWKCTISTGFDISHRQVTLTNISLVRDLHCWQLTFNWTPALPTFTSQQFSIILQPKSPTIKDLKLQKKNSLDSY